MRFFEDALEILFEILWGFFLRLFEDSFGDFLEILGRCFRDSF